MGDTLISVRVDVVGENLASRIVPLKLNMTVEEAFSAIQQKVSFNNPDWGLFLPAGVEGRKGRWLKDMDKPLSHYDLRNGVRISNAFVSQLPSPSCLLFVPTYTHFLFCFLSS
jgi:hypothetical protein